MLQDTIELPANKRRFGVHRHLVAAIALIAATLAVVWLWARQHNYVPCVSDCGETFVAQLYARNFRLFGFAFGLIEDHATAVLQSAHPYYYTHNVNIGGLFYTALEILGIREFWAKQIGVLLIFGLGLFYLYRAVLFHSKSAVVAISALVFACTDFGLFLGFGVHALRVWSWLAMFGLLLHVGRFSYATPHKGMRDALLILVFATIAFGVGYEFWIICLCISVFIYLICSDSRLTSRDSWIGVLAVSTIFFVPFAIRQIHVAYVMGFDYWRQDFLYTFAIKIPFARYLIHIPSIAEIDAYYIAHNVMRPPSVPLDSVHDLAGQLRQLAIAFKAISLPTIGTLGVAIVVVVVVTSLLLVGLAGFERNRAKVLGRPRGRVARAIERAIHWSLNCVASRPGRTDILRTAHLVSALAVGMGLGAIVMLKMLLAFYVAMNMPLLGALVVICKGVVLGLAVEAISSGSPNVRLRQILAFVAAAIVVDQLVVQIENFKATKLMETDWITEVQNRPNSTFGVSFIAPVVAGFTSNWAVGIATGREREYLKRIDARTSPFTKADLFWFGERDAAKKNWSYLRPDYWLYFVIDRRADYYAIEPECRRDYLRRIFGSITERFGASGSIVVNKWVNPKVARSDDMPVVGVTLRHGLDIERVEVMVGDSFVQRMSYNCISGVAISALELGGQIPAGVHDVRAKVSFSDRGGAAILNIGTLEIDVEAPGAKPQFIQAPQPTVIEILNMYPNLDVAAKKLSPVPWEGFLLIDLRSINSPQ